MLQFFTTFAASLVRNQAQCFVLYVLCCPCAVKREDILGLKDYYIVFIGYIDDAIFLPTPIASKNGITK